LNNDISNDSFYYSNLNYDGHINIFDLFELIKIIYR
jgi:hypothetical protein